MQYANSRAPSTTAQLQVVGTEWSLRHSQKGALALVRGRPRRRIDGHIANASHSIATEPRDYPATPIAPEL